MKIKYLVQTIIAIALFAPLPALAAAKIPKPLHIRLCTTKPKQGYASCHIRVTTDKLYHPLVESSAMGFGPADLRSAYKLSGRANGKQIVAIVDAYDNPTMQGDLNTYSNNFGLPLLPPCVGDVSSSNIPCFEKVGQKGTSKLPAGNSGWASEIALDVEAVHAVCENCSILLVEATSPSMKNLLAAEDFAVSKANVVSNSWGGPEYAGEVALDSHFNHKGVAITASSGDSGYGVQYPAASPYVTAVGGTSLFLTASGKYQDENAWDGAGSGCSAYENKPAWQTDAKCAGRTVADVSAVADPATGFAIYTKSAPKGKQGWMTVGGTSLASPIIAATYALAGNPPQNTFANSLPYELGTKSSLHDVVGGSNGNCSPSYLCTGKTKYDGPTGLGSPNGISAF